MEPPVFNGKETVSQYMRRVDEFRTYLNTNKYNQVLGFLNELFSLRKFKNKDGKYVNVGTATSMTKFSKIPFSYFSTNNEHCERVTQKYLEWFRGSLDLDFNLDTNTNIDIADYIIHCLVRIVKSVGYKLVKRNKGGEYYYSIINRKD